MPLYTDASSSQKISSALTSPVSTIGTGDTVLHSLAVPSLAADTGQVYRFQLFGISTSNGTLIFKVHAGVNGTTSDAVVWQSITSTGQAANERAGFDGMLTVRLGGSSGSVQCEALSFARAGATAAAVAAAVATSTINTLNAWTITLSVTCSAGTFTAHQAVIEAV